MANSATKSMHFKDGVLNKAALINFILLMKWDYIALSFRIPIQSCEAFRAGSHGSFPCASPLCLGAEMVA